MQFVFYVLGPFLLCLGLAAGAFLAGLGHYRSKRIAGREAAVESSRAWMRDANTSMAGVLYAIYNHPDVEAAYERPLVRQLERLTESAPTTASKELSS